MMFGVGYLATSGNFIQYIHRWNIFFAFIAQLFVKVFELGEALAIFRLNVHQFPKRLFVLFEQPFFEVLFNYTQKPALVFIGYEK